MATIATPSPEVQTTMNPNEERELWTVVKEHERPPYFHPDEGVGNRLNRAARVVTEGRITPNSDGSYTVEGSAGRTYVCTESCTCPNSQKSKSKWCYHLVAVALYVEWQRRLQPLLLPPRPTVDERLAQYPVVGTSQGMAVHAIPVAALFTPTQEVSMADTEYIDVTETPSAATAILEPSKGHDAPQVCIPREYTVNIKGKTHVLYTGLVITARQHGLMSLSADWTYNDAELSLAHAVCTFADGRRYEESGDATPGNVSKGIAAHFRRVALTRAKARCLRDALGISEASVEELADESGRPPVPDMATGPRTSQGLRQRIWTMVKQVDPSITTRDACAAFIHARCGLVLAPEYYAEIVKRLEGQL